MTLGATEKLLLAEAVDNEDADGEVVSITSRRLAAQKAGEPAAEEFEKKPWPDPVTKFIDARSAAVVGELPRSIRDAATRIADAGRIIGWIGLGFVVAAFVVGFSANKLGSGQAVNVIAFPLLGLIAWNILVYLFLLARQLAKGGGFSLVTLIIAFVRRHTGRLGEKMESSSRTDSRILHRFAESWSRLRLPAAAKSLQGWFHVAAAVFAVGIVAGMYWQGLAREYKASWESTFLTDPETVHRFFDILFTPATLLSGLPAPTMDDVRLAADANGPAAKWIHLYAVTAALVIFIPRLALAFFSRLGATKLEKSADVHALFPGYVPSLVSPGEDSSLVVFAVPHRLKLESRQKESVREVAIARWGGRVVVDFAKAVDYGDEEDWPETGFENDPTAILLVMNFSSTPEEDSQGILVEQAKKLIHGEHEDCQLVILLDKSAFTARMEGLDEAEQRAEQRERAWERVLDKHGLRFAIVGNGKIEDEHVWHRSSSSKSAN
ncbi:MAG: DUF2868 domain-containing protein [Verrucomicrobiota bacterium]